MLWFLLFSNPFARKTRENRNPTWGDEFMMGNWSISSLDIVNNESLSNFNLYLMPHPTEDALVGTFSSNDTEEPFSRKVALRFNGTDRDSFNAFLQSDDGEETKITRVEYKFGDNQLLVAYGDIEGTNISYSANMFSDKTIEVTTFDRETKEVILYRGSKPDIHPQPNPFKKYMSVAFILFYMYSRKKDQALMEAAEEKKEAEQRKSGKKNKKNKNKKH